MASRRKRNLLKWSDSEMSHFLELYQQHECLWNRNCEAYKNKEARDMAIREIIFDLDVDLTETDIKNKIKSIRTMYRRELMLVVKSQKTGDEGLHEPTLTWYKQADSFLRAVVNITQDTASDVDEGEVRSSLMLTVTPLSESSETSGSVRLTPRPALQLLARKRKADTINEDINDSDKVPNVSRIKETDEFDHFGSFIAAQLRKMPEYDAILCQEELHGVIRQYRLRLVTNSASIISESTLQSSSSEHIIVKSPVP